MGAGTEAGVYVSHTGLCSVWSVWDLSVKITQTVFLFAKGASSYFPSNGYRVSGHSNCIRDYCTSERRLSQF